MDTAQAEAPAETDPNAQLEQAANAFKTFVDPPPEQPRAENGQFTSTTEEVEDLEDEAEELEEGSEGEDVEEDEEEEAAETAQPLPPSWPADKAEVWNALPADAQAVIAERDAEQLRATNAKFQEIANIRKVAEAAARNEANAKRDDYLSALETVEALYKPVKPDPRAFGYGTQQYNAAGFNAALAQYEEVSANLAQFSEQRKAIQKEAAEEAEKAFTEWKQQTEAQFAPKLLADVPELKDTAKAMPTLHELVSYAIQSGIPEDVFAEDQQDQITSAQLHILWKAKEYDKLRSTKTVAKPKQAGPAVKPGVSSPRSAQRATRQKQAFDRLDREGSIEAGAAVFKQLFKG